MENQRVKYYCDESSKPKEKWDLILSEAFNHADSVGFNVHNNEIEFEQVGSELIEKDVEKRRNINSGRNFHLYRLSDQLKEIIGSKEFDFWALGTFEDISFWRNGSEIFSTNSHENYLIARLTDEQRKKWDGLGFDFAFDWGTDPTEEFENEPTTPLIERLKRLIGMKTPANKR
ncbi:MAG: hypothetical protein RLN90_06180 [Balneolaceae bacterium]